MAKIPVWFLVIAGLIVVWVAFKQPKGQAFLTGDVYTSPPNQPLSEGVYFGHDIRFGVTPGQQGLNIFGVGGSN